MRPSRALALAGGLGLGAGGTWLLVVRGGLTLHVGVGRRIHPLGPIRREIEAPPQVVFDVIAAPYLGRTTRALQRKLRVLERGADMVLAEHFTPFHRLTASTVEVVRFDPPSQVSFRLVRGPVPHVTETFRMEPSESGTAFTYTGEIGADFWALGTRWAKMVAASWERAVDQSVAAIVTEAERRAGRRPS